MKNISEQDIKDFSQEYSFHIPSELFCQLTHEQQKLWRKEIEEAVIAGAHFGQKNITFEL